MSFLFKPRPKSPSELAVTLKEASLILQQASKTPSKAADKAVKDTTKSIYLLKNLFVGTSSLLFCCFTFRFGSRCRAHRRVVSGGLQHRPT